MNAERGEPLTAQMTAQAASTFFRDQAAGGRVQAGAVGQEPQVTVAPRQIRAPRLRRRVRR